MRIYKSGIDIAFSGTEGIDYVVERLYYDDVMGWGNLYYIKSTTDITLSHNAMDTAGVLSADGSADAYTTPATLPVGVIKFKPDGDQRWDRRVPSWNTYSAPFNFAGLNYGIFGASGTAVVGSAGDNGVALTGANKESRYCKGVLDSAGDETHILTFADDDDMTSGVFPRRSDEFTASDGKIHPFIVNPDAPTIMVTEGTGGQFHSSPPRTYFTNKMFAMETRFTGPVSIRLKDMYARNISYRLNGGSTVNVGAATVTLTEANFSDGLTTLETWVTATPAKIRTRTINKAVTYPSAGETHGDKLWIDAAHWTSEVKPRINTWWMATWAANDSTNNNVATLNAQIRLGRRSIKDVALENALVARDKGMAVRKTGATLTYADAAKASMMECYCVLDPVGIELTGNDGGAVASREIYHRGYYDVNPIIHAMAAYDVLIGYYRTDQGYPNGMTIIQDYFIRDSFAKWVHNCMLWTGNWGPQENDNYNIGGMWDISRKLGAVMAACMMPKYSTPYYGTSGMDGTTATVYPNCPYPTDQITWKQAFINNDTPLSPFPNYGNRMGVEEYWFSADGVWHDKPGYTPTDKCGHILAFYLNLRALFFPAIPIPKLEAAMADAAAGVLTSAQEGPAPTFRSWLGAQNAWYDTFRDAANPTTLAKATSHAESLGKQYASGGPLYVLWYNHELPFGTDVSTPVGNAIKPVMLPRAGSYESSRTVTITSLTPGASIYYTTNGATPTTSSTLYTVPVVISSTATLKAIADTVALNPSEVASETYVISVTGKPNKPRFNVQPR